MTTPNQPREREWWLGQVQIDSFDRRFRQAFDMPNHSDANEIHVVPKEELERVSKSKTFWYEQYKRVTDQLFAQSKAWSDRRARYLNRLMRFKSDRDRLTARVKELEPLAKVALESMPGRTIAELTAENEAMKAKLAESEDKSDWWEKRHECREEELEALKLKQKVTAECSKQNYEAARRLKAALEYAKGALEWEAPKHTRERIVAEIERLASGGEAE